MAATKYAKVEHRTELLDSRAFAGVIDELGAMPTWLRSIVMQTPGRKRRERSSSEPDAFTLHEHVWHLRDIEVLGYSQRLQRMLEEEHPFLPDVDGARLAIERHYRGLPLLTGLEELASARAANVARLRSLSRDALARRGELEGVGCLTLSQLVEAWLNHDRGHRGEIETLLGEGRG